MRADDEAEEETNIEPILISASERAETRREPAETQTLEHTAASGHSAKRDRQGLRLGISKVMSYTDHIDTDADDEFDIRSPLKKRTRTNHDSIKTSDSGAKIQISPQLAVSLGEGYSFRSKGSCR